MTIYTVNVYYNGGIDEMGYQSDEPIDEVLKKVRNWLWNRYKRFTKLGYEANLDNLTYAELLHKDLGIYHELNTCVWDWDTTVEEYYEAKCGKTRGVLFR